jgi:molecular chaperone DnaK
MLRTKIDYGIDLGTTNSAISRMDNGKVIIIKSDESTQTDTTPSCIHYNKKQILFRGQKAFNLLGNETLEAFKKYSKTKSTEEATNTFIEFKRTMGTEQTFKSDNMHREYSSEELSAEILKKLKGYARDEQIEAIVITVPAMFRQAQLDATQRAAELAGFKYCELLQEPIAASLAYGIDTKQTSGYWVVFDFGGGTFDAALMKLEEGIMKVLDTDGDNNLGGKNIDYAVVDNILLPYLTDKYSMDDILNNEFGKRKLREALKGFAEESKISLSKNDNYEFYKEDLGEDDDGEEIILDLKINLQQFEEVAKSTLQRSIDITKKIIKRNNLSIEDIDTVILVGGPTKLQTFRKMLKEQLGKIDFSIDPMIAVANGAAIFASTKEIPLLFQKRDTARIQLSLKYPSTTVEIEENLGIRIEKEKTTGPIPNRLFVEIQRMDKAWTSGLVEIEDAEIIALDLSPNKTNIFSITLKDEKGNFLSAEPQEFSIIQGMKIAEATLPYHIGINILYLDKGKKGVDALKGLEKNKTLPAKGKGVFRTQKEIRPMKKEDEIKIEIFEMKNDNNGSPAFLNEFVSKINITGEDIKNYLPADSEVELTLEIDSSRRIKFSAFFPYLDQTIDLTVPTNIQKNVDADYLSEQINIAREKVEEVGDPSDIEQNLDEIEEILENGKGDPNTRTQVMERLREELTKIHKLEEDMEWPSIEDELDDTISRLKITIQRYGDEKTTQLMPKILNQVESVKKQKKPKLAKELMDQLNAMNWAIIDKGAGIALDISIIKGFDDDFEMNQWSNRSKARQLINEAKESIFSNKATRESLRQILDELFKLLPPPEKPIIDKDDKVLRK